MMTKVKYKTNIHESDGLEKLSIPSFNEVEW